MILYGSDKVTLREVILRELSRQYVKGFLIPHSRDDGSMEMFFADDIMSVVEEFFAGWEEPWCDRDHCPNDCTETCGYA